jgi:hypothetical protein
VAGGSGGIVTVISSAASGQASAPVARHSQASNFIELATIRSPRLKNSRLLIILDQGKTRQMGLIGLFYVYGIDAVQKGQMVNDKANDPKCRFRLDDARAGIGVRG